MGGSWSSRRCRWLLVSRVWTARMCCVTFVVDAASLGHVYVRWSSYDKYCWKSGLVTHMGIQLRYSFRANHLSICILRTRIEEEYRQNLCLNDTVKELVEDAEDVRFMGESTWGSLQNDPDEFSNSSPFFFGDMRPARPARPLWLSGDRTADRRKQLSELPRVKLMLMWFGKESPWRFIEYDNF